MTAPRQRLVLCLDGTWNNRDDSTNVLHHHVLTREGEVDDGWIQRVYYDEGVGTGLLDRVSGGAFGFGLERNVREAYNWLVQHFNDAGRGRDHVADEIYIFGFSRGAYTARSLVGFISRCGLLERGAPLTISQLWRGYCILGRQQEERSSVWDAFAKPPASPFLPINQLRVDPWTPPERVYATVTDRNPTEELLARWSRRVRITYLGIYDTVGAMGWDALAIPGLRSRLALHHNMHSSTLVQQCRHALAIDENRSSFHHTPLLAYLGHDERPTRTAPATHYWKQQRNLWIRKIEQRWFVGAHANIGGGYDNNGLAQLPLAWVLEGACQRQLRGRTVAKLRGKPFRPGQLADLPVHALPTPNDSLREFGKAIPVHLLRVKRHHRPLVPPPDLRAGRTPEAPGFRLESIHETVDPSVFDYYTRTGRDVPPNLGRWARDHAKGDEATLATRLRPARWLTGWRDGIATLVWGGLAGAGFEALARFFAGDGGELNLTRGLSVALVFVAIDAWEHRLVHTLALAPTPSETEVALRAHRDVSFWLRSAGVVCVFAGLALIGSWMLPPAALAVITRSSGPALAPPLLGLQLGLFALGGALLSWVSEPLRRINLGPISALQWTRSPGRAHAVLQGWRERLHCRWDPLDADPHDGPAARRMRFALSEALHRDSLGLVPLYLVVLACGSWLGVPLLTAHWPALAVLAHPIAGWPLWAWLVTITGIADGIENHQHRRTLNAFAEGHAPTLANWGLALSATAIKSLGFSVLVTFSLAAVVGNTVKLLRADTDLGWSGGLAIGVSAVLAIGALGAIWTGVTRRRRR